MLNEKKYNVNLLAQELRAAGVCKAGNCSSTGVVWDDNGVEIQEREDVATILEAHNPYVVTTQPATLEERLEAAELLIGILLTQGDV